LVIFIHSFMAMIAHRCHNVLTKHKFMTPNVGSQIFVEWKATTKGCRTFADQKTQSYTQSNEEITPVHPYYSTYNEFNQYKSLVLDYDYLLRSPPAPPSTPIAIPKLTKVVLSFILPGKGSKAYSMHTMKAFKLLQWYGNQKPNVEHFAQDSVTSILVTLRKPRDMGGVMLQLRKFVSLADNYGGVGSVGFNSNRPLRHAGGHIMERTVPFQPSNLSVDCSFGVKEMNLLGSESVLGPDRIPPFDLFTWPETLRVTATISNLSSEKTAVNEAKFFLVANGFARMFGIGVPKGLESK